MGSLFKSIMNIRRNELPLSLLMFSYFFLVITSFWILKPIKKSIFMQYYDKTGFNIFGWDMTAAQAEMLAKVMNMIVAFVAVIIFTWLVRRFHRQKLTFIFSTFCMIAYTIYSFLINNPGDVTVWTFYLFGDLFNTLMVATFFAFLNDSVTPEAAKRLYGLIVLGGVTGGAFGTSVLAVWIEYISASGWMWICFGLALAIISVALAAGRIVAKNHPNIKTVEPPQKKISKPSNNPAIEGAKLVFRSRYLLAIVAIVGLYEIASQTMNYQFTATVAHYLDGPAIGKQFANIFAFTNWLALFVQLFLTSFIMTRLGLKTALMILPLAMMLGSTGFLVMPILWMGSLLWPLDNSFNYSVNQSAKEALYTPTTRDEKYKAKAFIDMFIQRFAKVLAIGVSLAASSMFTDFASIRWLSLFAIIVIVAWFIAVRYAGRKFQEMTSQ